MIQRSQRRVGLASMLMLALAASFAVSACGSEDAGAQNKTRAHDSSKAIVAARASKKNAADERDDSPLSLARAAGLKAYAVDDSAVPRPEGAVSGQVIGPATMPADTFVVPKIDINECRPFAEVTIPHRVRGVGQAVVWLVGVTHGPRDTTSRRVMLRMEKCRLTPRVQRAPMGATVNVGTRNAMLSKLTFTDVGDSTIAARTVISLNDEGQVVPSSDALSRGGIVQVQDANHPWARAYIAVAPHPFVAITTPDGKFSFEHVPPGSYTLVAWHERLGARSAPVVITPGGALKSNIQF